MSNLQTAGMSLMSLNECMTSFLPSFLRSSLPSCRYNPTKPKESGGSSRWQQAGAAVPVYLNIALEIHLTGGESTVSVNFMYLMNKTGGMKGGGALMVALMLCFVRRPSAYFLHNIKHDLILIFFFSLSFFHLPLLL